MPEPRATLFARRRIYWRECWPVPPRTALSASLHAFPAQARLRAFLGHRAFYPAGLRHAPTLSRLEFIACRSEGNLKFVHWAHIWDSFAAELTALIAVHVDEHHDRDSGGLLVRYVVPESMGYRQFVIESRNVADAEALRCFHMTVVSRTEET